jgi:hypothetical protein
MSVCVRIVVSVQAQATVIVVSASLPTSTYAPIVSLRSSHSGNYVISGGSDGGE